MGWCRKAKPVIGSVIQAAEPMSPLPTVPFMPPLLSFVKQVRQSKAGEDYPSHESNGGGSNPPGLEVAEFF